MICLCCKKCGSCTVTAKIPWPMSPVTELTVSRLFMALNDSCNKYGKFNDAKAFFLNFSKIGTPETSNTYVMQTASWVPLTFRMTGHDDQSARWVINVFELECGPVWAALNVKVLDKQLNHAAGMSRVISRNGGKLHVSNITDDLSFTSGSTSKVLVNN